LLDARCSICLLPHPAANDSCGGYGEGPSATVTPGAAMAAKAASPTMAFRGRLGAADATASETAS